MSSTDEYGKVILLEDAVINGTLDDVKTVYNTYKPFEITARALGLACRYRGLEFVRKLIELGATFVYDAERTVPEWERFVAQYHTENKTASGALYKTGYSLMLLASFPALSQDALGRSPIYGVSYIAIPDGKTDKALPLNERTQTAKYLIESKAPNFSADELLYFAILWCDFDLAQALIDQGVDLDKEPPRYYSPIWWDSPKPGKTYLEMITEGDRSVYWNDYLDRLSALSESELCRVFGMLGELAASAGKKLIVTQKLFDSVKWEKGSFGLAVKYADLSKVDQKKALEKAAAAENVAVLSLMAANGWLDQPARREKLITFAEKGGCRETLAWLLDFKNRTVDIKAEQAKTEEKIKKELAESPDSVSALKKSWGFKKQADGSLVITNYKGSETEVAIPAAIGKNKVTAIEGSFSAAMSSKLIDNGDVRKRITAVAVPEGVRSIGAFTFDSCKSLSSVSLPNSLEEIGRSAFDGCKGLSELCIPGGVKSIGYCAFSGCGDLKRIRIPESVIEIQPRAFLACPNLTIHAPAGSYAEQYARDNNIPFVAE